MTILADLVIVVRLRIRLALGSEVEFGIAELDEANVHELGD